MSDVGGDHGEERRELTDCPSVSADVLFSGTADGKIVKLVGRRIHMVTRLGKLPCGESCSCVLPVFTCCLLFLCAVRVYGRGLDFRLETLQHVQVSCVSRLDET